MINVKRMLERINAFAGREVQVKAEPSVPEARVSARMENTVPGTCPFCQKAMTTAKVDDNEVFLCEADRFVSPMPNTTD